MLLEKLNCMSTIIVQIPLLGYITTNNFNFDLERAESINEIISSQTAKHHEVKGNK